MKSSLNSPSPGGLSLQPEASVSPVRVGVLGCADIARRKFIPALHRSSAAELVAIASREPARAAALEPAGTCRLTDYAGLVAAPEIDLVYIALPNHLHEEWVEQALQHGKHVICEKPLALSVAAVERLLAQAERSGCLLYENLMFLHHPQHAAVRELIAGGRIGPVRTLRCAFGFPLPRPGDFRLDPARGGGVIHDLARYPLGAAQYFLQGDDYRFHGVTLWRDGLDWAVHGCAVTSAHELFQFSIAFGQQYECWYEIVGELGKVRVDRAFTTPADLANRLQVTCASDDQSFTIPAADHFQLMLEQVCMMLRTGGDFGPAHARTRTLARRVEQMTKGCSHVDF